jgi:hypothetical protein
MRVRRCVAPLAGSVIGDNSRRQRAVIQMSGRPLIWVMRVILTDRKRRAPRCPPFTSCLAEVHDEVHSHEGVRDAGGGVVYEALKQVCSRRQVVAQQTGVTW